jgi:hypothetical protein
MVIVLKLIATAITGFAAILIIQRYFLTRNPILKAQAGVFICFFGSFLVLFLNHFFPSWQRSATGPSLALAIFGSFSLFNVLRDLYYDDRFRRSLTIKVFLRIYFIVGLFISAIAMYFVYNYYDFRGRGLILPQISYIVGLIYFPLQFIIYSLVIIKISDLINGIKSLDIEVAKINDIDRFLLWNRYSYIRNACCLFLIGLLFLLIDLYISYYSTYAVFGWLFMIAFIFLSYMGIAPNRQRIERIYAASSPQIPSN